MTKINVGCGLNPTKGWRNFDNSPSLRLARVPFLATCLFKAGLLDVHQYRFVRFAAENRLEYADVTRRLPLGDDSVEAAYSSHMFEHLDQAEAAVFLREARRVLRSGGMLRLAVPDLGKLVTEYLKTNDADALVAGTYMALPKPRTFLQRAKVLLVGARHHHWNYDGPSLCHLLLNHGFVAAEVMPPGRSRIADPNLDLHEREPESVYVEAMKP